MSSEYPQAGESKSPSHGTGGPEPGVSASAAGSEQREAPDRTEGAVPPILSNSPGEKGDASGQPPSEEAAAEGEGKKPRILIGSQRDPTVFTQYKPKPNLAFPGTRLGRDRGQRRPKTKRPRTPKQPTAASPETPASQPAPSLPEEAVRPEPPAAAPERGTNQRPLGEPLSGVPERTLAGSGLSVEVQETSFPSVNLTSTTASLEPAQAETQPTASLEPPAVVKSTEEEAISAASASIASDKTLSRAASAESPTTAAVSAEATAPSILPPEALRTAEVTKQPEAEASAPDIASEPTELPLPSLPSPLPPGGIAPKQKYPVPNLRAQLPDDLADELEQTLAETPVEQMLVESAISAQTPLLEPESRHQARIVRIHRDEVFVELGSREQGVLALKQFLHPPEVGQEIEVIVQRYAPEEGLYELTLPASAAVAAEWSQLAEGMVVEARVTGQNAGGLECELGHIRGFIPISMVDIYRVTDLTDYVGQKVVCKVIECNPQRGNLVLSRRAVLEQQREEARRQLLSSLAPGQIREGVVRKLMPFGAFVDLGQGVDGLIPISQMSWRRINHPSEVLQEGQRVETAVEKVDPASGRISLSLRHREENPWLHAAEKYPPNSLVRGVVRRVMDYGAFVELESGVEGLVHISELSHKRVGRPRDVVQEGQEVEVMVLSVDPAQRRISLSIRQALPPEPPPAEKPPETQPAGEPMASESASAGPAPAEPSPLPKKMRQKKPQQLKGGLGRSPRSSRFGLNW